MVSKNTEAKIIALMKKYPDSKSAIMPALTLIQKEKGHISEEDTVRLAAIFNVPAARIFGIISFYSMYQDKPVGQYHIQVCTNISCSLMDAGHILDCLEQKLGIKAGQTTPDGKFTLTPVECLGSCGTAPVMQINDQFYEGVTPQKVEDILANL